MDNWWMHEMKRNKLLNTHENFWKLISIFCKSLVHMIWKKLSFFIFINLYGIAFFACYFVCFNYSSKKINLPKQASLDDLILSLVLLFIQFCDKFILKVLANYNIQYTKRNYACDKRLPTNMFILRRSVPLKLQHMNATAYEITCTVTVY